MSQWWESLGVRFERDLRREVGEGSEVVLVDFPDHANVGDSAIWCGEIEALNRCGTRIVASYSSYNFNPSHFRQVLSRHTSAVVLIHGGGNLGGLYEHHHRLRLAVLQSSHGSRVVQMPQSLDWASERHRDELVQAASPFGRDAVFMVRDKGGFGRISEVGLFGCTTPDAIHALERTQALAFKGPLIHARTDGESASSLSNLSVNSSDWPPERRRAWRRQAADALLRVGLTREGSMQGRLENQNLLARQRLERGIRLLAGHSLVLTDRLHGMLIAQMLGIPVSAVDNSTGKLSRYVDTWIKPIDPVPVTFHGSWTEAFMASDLGSPT
ncbi:polysaccharide pyruvyl transferase family protein [Nocardioides sp.]|uniref:polysaccharide pyruvyl transferase family protein n=1 Tax=Nocardioides sp. TaxID=35761 RepID=UPI0035689E5E